METTDSLKVFFPRDEQLAPVSVLGLLVKDQNNDLKVVTVDVEIINGKHTIPVSVIGGSVTLQATDIQLGAVELKDKDLDVRTSVVPVSSTENALVTYPKIKTSTFNPQTVSVPSTSFIQVLTNNEQRVALVLKNVGTTNLFISSNGTTYFVLLPNETISFSTFKYVGPLYAKSEVGDGSLTTIEFNE